MNNILKLRKERKITQEQLAKLLNTSRITIRNYENSITEPKFDHLKKLAKYFNVSIDYLLGNTDIRMPILPKTEDPILNEKFDIAEKILYLDIEKARAINTIIEIFKKD